MSKTIIPIMFCFDKNYVIPAAVAFYSLLENNEKEALGGGVEFRLYVVHNDIPLEHQNKLHETIKPFNHFAKLEFVDGGGCFDEIWKKIQSKNHFSKEMFYKLITPSLFSRYDKIIISDVDVVFLGSIIREFLSFDTDDDFLIGGVVSNKPEDFFPIPNKGYRKRYRLLSTEDLIAIQYGVAGGYLIINIKKWKKNNIQDIAIKHLQQKANNLVLPEQDILSIVCYPHIKKIHPAHIVCHSFWKKQNKDDQKGSVYTDLQIKEMNTSPIQLHYVGSQKPWNTPSTEHSDLWYIYLCKTSFLKEFLNQFEEIIERKKQKNTWIYKLKKKLRNPLDICDKIRCLIKIK